jgi:DmsE family decaheme c-type cytochrome
MGRAGDFGPRQSCSRPVQARFTVIARRFLKLFKAILVGGAVVGLVQPAFAVGFELQPQASQTILPTGGQGLYAALRDLDGPSPASVQPQRDGEAFSTLASFATSVAGRPQTGDRTELKRALGSQAIFDELKEFARSVGAARPLSNAGRVKLAEADNAMDALKEFLNRNNSAPPPAEAPKAVAPAPAVKPVRPAVEAHFVGDKVCLTCHATHAEAFSKTMMGRLWRNQPNPQGWRGKFACENCHGAGSEHVKLGGGRGVGGIISFRSNDPTHSVKELNAICLTCHERGDRTYWSGSTHEVRAVACTDCHTVMQNVSAKFNLKTVYEPETCFQCHKDRRAQMYRTSHMPLREGKMVCSDCHQPHGTANEALLRTATINETCYKCHAEKRGPFLFEHTPVRENCLNCHDAHGTINEYLLKISRPRLCTECHGFGHAPQAGFNSYQIIGRACNNCHTQVHGTNSPSGALLHR